MTAQLDPLTLPTTCAVAWADKDSIYVQFPGPGGIPCITRHPKTYAALTIAFGILCENPMETRKIVPRHPKTNIAKGVDPRFRAAALAALKRQGIV